AAPLLDRAKGRHGLARPPARGCLGLRELSLHPHRRHPHRQAPGQDRRQRLRAEVDPDHTRSRLQVRRSDMRLEPFSTEAAPAPAEDVPESPPVTRPRALAVGDLAGWSEGALAGAVEVRRVAPSELAGALGDRPDLLFLDGQLPVATMTRILE